MNVVIGSTARHAEALWASPTRGVDGETYNVGGHNEWPISACRTNLRFDDELAPKLGGISRKLITFVKTAGHDRRYAIDASKIEARLGWRPAYTFERGIRETVQWYLDNQEWVRTVITEKSVG